MLQVRFAMLDLDGNGRIDALDFLQIRSQLELRLHEVNRARRRNPAGGHHHRRDRLFGGGGGGGDDDAQAPLWWRVGRRVGSSRVVVQSQRCAALGASTCLYPSSHAPATCFYPPPLPPAGARRSARRGWWRC